MDLADWIATYGPLGGLLGGLAGVVGAGVSIIVFLRSGIMRRADLRIRLRKDINELRSIVEGLRPLLLRARQSRERVSAATGQAGALQAWTLELDVDLARVAELESTLPEVGTAYAGLKESDLERKLVVADGFILDARRLREKYQASLAADDNEREKIFQGMLARANRKA